MFGEEVGYIPYVLMFSLFTPWATKRSQLIFVYNFVKKQRILNFNAFFTADTGNLPPIFNALNSIRKSNLKGAASDEEFRTLISEYFYAADIDAGIDTKSSGDSDSDSESPVTGESADVNIVHSNLPPIFRRHARCDRCVYRLEAGRRVFCSLYSNTAEYTTQ